MRAAVDSILRRAAATRNLRTATPEQELSVYREILGIRVRVNLLGMLATSGQSFQVSGEVGSTVGVGLPEYLHGGNNAVEIRPDRDSRTTGRITRGRSLCQCGQFSVRSWRILAPCG